MKIRAWVWVNVRTKKATKLQIVTPDDERWVRLLETYDMRDGGRDTLIVGVEYEAA